MSKAPEKVNKKSNKIDTKLPNDMKEKTYLTRQVDTSIAILDSPEYDILLESLLFLSKYADIKLNNLTYLQQKGLMEKLLNLFNKNVCILRLSLRLLNILLSLDDVLSALDQVKYDDKILEISRLYMNHSDLHVKEFCIAILSKLAASCRITSLIFEADLFTPVLTTLKTTKTLSLLQSTLEFFYVLLNAPAAVSALPMVKNFEISVLLGLLDNPDHKITDLAFKVLIRITSFTLEVFQKLFKHAKLVERMLVVIMDPEMRLYHQDAFTIILNCMNCEETSCYFIESLEFLDFCRWTKTCDPEYLLSCINLFENLSQIPHIKQTLFDLSVEDSILFFLRSTDKCILNKTCIAISNMGVHKYCCEHMITPVVIKTIVGILERKDDLDPGNEIALRTISDFMRRSLKTIDLLNSLGFQNILLDYFKKGTKGLSQDSYLRVLEMLYKFAVHPLYQKSIINEKFFGELLKLVEIGPEELKILSTEILTYFIENKNFFRYFSSAYGPLIIIKELRTSVNPKVIKNILVFIHCSMIEENLITDFIRNDLIVALKQFPEKVKAGMPLIDTILNLTYNLHLPLKFFETGRIEITDRLRNKFYLMNGRWTAPFPFLEILEALKMSTILTIYVVDYTYEVIEAASSESHASQEVSVSSRESLNKRSSSFSNKSFSFMCSYNNPFDINYGELSPDPYLPRFINHINKLLANETSLENKISILAGYVDTLLCGPCEDATMPQKNHTYKFHIESLKFKLGTNMIPIGFLRIGFHCERALLFKALADRCDISCSLVKGGNRIYWNEVALFDSTTRGTLQFYIVDLMINIGHLLVVGSREANQYCNVRV
ncbi:unnamed protein product [Phaedon cochleariae]|uniref:EDR1/CTR1/ARMC3-like peptidase-like domain-containing protein n=1 Tax=Phaedon cochleariae TaxID=80249 RepID=A0A9N9X7F1_PHACE|nr:unnamed protein product [Phaedon cochleariae]